jgi:hypothetical protein
MCSELECYDNADYRWRNETKNRYKAVGKRKPDSLFGHLYVVFLWNAELRAHHSAIKGYVYGSAYKSCQTTVWNRRRK